MPERRTINLSLAYILVSSRIQNRKKMVGHYFVKEHVKLMILLSNVLTLTPNLLSAVTLSMSFSWLITLTGTERNNFRGAKRGTERNMFSSHDIFFSWDLKAHII